MLFSSLFTSFIIKTKRKGGLTEETLRVVNYLFDRNLAATPANKKDAKSGVDKKDAAAKKVSYIFVCFFKIFHS